jgi:sulfur-carrier protein
MTTAVRVRVPAGLRGVTDGRAVVDVEVADATPNLAGVLETLARTCPGVVDRVLDERGDVRRHVNLFVGDEEVRALGGLDVIVADGAEISILPAVSGG